MIILYFPIPMYIWMYFVVCICSGRHLLFELPSHTINFDWDAHIISSFLIWYRNIRGFGLSFGFWSPPPSLPPYSSLSLDPGSWILDSHLEFRRISGFYSSSAQYSRERTARNERKGETTKIHAVSRCSFHFSLSSYLTSHLFISLLFLFKPNPTNRQFPSDPPSRKYFNKYKNYGLHHLLSISPRTKCLLTYNHTYNHIH